MRVTGSERGLRLRGLELRLDGARLLRLDRHVAPGEILTVMGRSGSGKSSLLDFIAGFLGRDFDARGDILLNGRELTRLPAQERRIGLMFQTPLLFPHMSVRENLMFALPSGAGDRRQRAEQALGDVGLAGFGDRDPAKLSGGQQTRVALMRTLLGEPEALLLDEPFSSLDKERRGEMRALVFGAARAGGLPVVLVTHDEDDAIAAGGPVVRLDAAPQTP